jgi:hypothetical protein
MRKRHLEIENQKPDVQTAIEPLGSECTSKKTKIERKPFYISPLSISFIKVPDNKLGFAKFDECVYINGSFDTTRLDNLKYGYNSKIVLQVTRKNVDKFTVLLASISKVIGESINESRVYKIRSPISGFRKLLLSVKTDAHLLDIVRPYLKNETSKVTIDCEIMITGVMFTNDNIVHLCMKMNDISIPWITCLGDTHVQKWNDIKFTNDTACELADSLVSYKFVSFKEPIIINGTFTIAEIQDIINSKYTNVLFRLKSSDGFMFDTFIKSLYETLQIGSDTKIVNPLFDSKLPIRMDPDLVSYIYPYLDMPHTKFQCDISISGVFVSGLNVHLRMDMLDINLGLEV